VVVERIVIKSKIVKFYLLINIENTSISNIIMCKTLLLKFLGLLYYDNLIKCDTIPKLYNFIKIMGFIKKY